MNPDRRSVVVALAVIGATLATLTGHLDGAELVRLLLAVASYGAGSVHGAARSTSTAPPVEAAPSTPATLVA